MAIEIKKTAIQQKMVQAKKEPHAERVALPALACTGLDAIRLKERDELLPGRLIVIEGTDSVGRSTQLRLLRPWLESSGYAVVDTEMTRSELVGAGLKQAKEGHTLGPITLNLFYATDLVDRFESQILPALRAVFVNACGKRGVDVDHDLDQSLRKMGLNVRPSDVVSWRKALLFSRAPTIRYHSCL